MQKMYGEKKTKSECKYIGFKNNRLEYKCKECNNESAKSVKGLIRKFPITYNFLMAILVNLYYYYERGYIPMNTWIAGRDLIKHYHLKIFL